jgi:hypothetical protein
MTFISVPVPSPFVWLVQSLAAAIYRWNYRLWVRHRPQFRECPACGNELAIDTKLLLQHGFYRGAVSGARLQLEQRLVKLAGRIQSASDRPSKKQYTQIASFLRKYGVVSSSERNRIHVLYGRCSKIVHGSPVSGRRARRIVRDIDVLLMQLDDSQGIRDQGFVVEESDIADATLANSGI